MSSDAGNAGAAIPATDPPANPRGPGARLREEILVVGVALVGRLSSIQALLLWAIARMRRDHPDEFYAYFESVDELVWEFLDVKLADLAKQLAAAGGRPDDGCRDPIAAAYHGVNHAPRARRLGKGGRRRIID
jgi:hypothetical protein